MRTFGAALTGANCTVGGQTIISLNTTEDVDADYASAAAVSLAPGGPWSPGTVVETIEGGVSTGYWVVEESTRIESGDRTWRKRKNTGYYHLPLVSYHLKRKNYHLLRGTISKQKIGTAKWPPKFCSLEHYINVILPDVQERRKLKEIWHTDAEKELSSWIRVSDGKGIITRIANWFGVSVIYMTGLPNVADEYIPVSKSAMGAIKEVASWSGASVYLDRNGTLRVFRFEDRYSSYKYVRTPPAILERETSQRLYDPSLVTVVGKGYRGRIINWPARPAHWSANGLFWREATPAHTSLHGKWVKPVEYSEGVGYGPEAAVEERIEINNYMINPAIAQALARDRLGRVILTSSLAKIKGPAEGAQDIQPVVDKVLVVTRSLSWTGEAYKYEMELVAPNVALSGWGGTLSSEGWW